MGSRVLALRRRAVNRSAYRPDPVASSVIEGLQATASRLGFTLSVLTDRAVIGRVAGIAGRAGTTDRCWSCAVISSTRS